jgi:small subunit ribosomal protein S1
VVQGIVKNITDYGAFVDLGGVDGLLHITDLAWRRVRHPSEMLTVGQEVTAKILKYDQDKNRVSLGIKQLGDDPWVGIARRYPPNTRLFGKVTNLKLVSKVWYTFLKWIGQTRTLRQAKLFS